MQISNMYRAKTAAMSMRHAKDAPLKGMTNGSRSQTGLAGQSQVASPWRRHSVATSRLMPTMLEQKIIKGQEWNK